MKRKLMIFLVVISWYSILAGIQFMTKPTQEHEKQPARCMNFKGHETKSEYCGAKCKTICQPDKDGRIIITEERDCKVYCRKDSCDCWGKCDS